MSKKVILVVDDEKDIVELVRFNLERDGFKVIPSYNGEDALILVKNQLPDLIMIY